LRGRRGRKQAVFPVLKHEQQYSLLDFLLLREDVEGFYAENMPFAF